jgi:hypothetical protein
MDLVTDMVAAQGRLRRMRTLETSLFDLQISQHESTLFEMDIDRQINESAAPAPGSGENDVMAVAFTQMTNQSKSLDLCLRYETSFRRAFNKSLETLMRLRKSSGESAPSEELRNDDPPQRETALESPEAIEIQAETTRSMSIRAPEKSEIDIKRRQPDEIARNGRI